MGGGEFHRLFHLVLCIEVTYADWEILRTEINQCRDRFSPSAKSRIVSAYICLHLNLRTYETRLEHWILSGSETSGEDITRFQLCCFSVVSTVAVTSDDLRTKQSDCQI